MKPASVAEPIADPSRAMAVGGIGPDRDDHLAGTDREGGDGRALDDRERVVLEQVSGPCRSPGPRRSR